MNSKKGLSTVIATVLIIMITIIAFVMIATVIIPMIKGWLCESRSCYDLTDQIVIDTESEFTCNNATSTVVVLKRGLKEIDISTIKISFSTGGDSKVVDLIEGAVPGDVKMKSGENIQLPPLGGSRSYIINKRYEYVMVSPTIKGTCTVACKTSEGKINNQCP